MESMKILILPRARMEKFFFEGIGGGDGGVFLSSPITKSTMGWRKLLAQVGRYSSTNCD